MPRGWQLFSGWYWNDGKMFSGKSGMGLAWAWHGPGLEAQTSLPAVSAQVHTCSQAGLLASSSLV